VSRVSRQCGILSISQAYRPPRPVTGIALLYIWTVSYIFISAPRSPYGQYHYRLNILYPQNMVVLTKLYFLVYLVLIFHSPHLRAGSINTSGASEIKTFLSQFSIWNLASVILKKRKPQITVRSWPKMGDVVLQNFGVQKGYLQSHFCGNVVLSRWKKAFSVWSHSV
jgi:hypothetical protein